MKAKNYYFGFTVILGSSLLVGCVPSRVHNHSEHSQSSHEYREYRHHDERPQYERQQPEYRRQPNYGNQNRPYEVPHEVPQIYEREQPRYQPRQPRHSPYNEQPHTRQIIEQPKEREIIPQRPQIRPQEDSAPQISTPPVRTRDVEQKTSPSQIPTPPPEIIKTPSIPPAQPCSRRTGCEDSKSTSTDSSRRER